LFCNFLKSNFYHLICSHFVFQRTRVCFNDWKRNFAILQNEPIIVLIRAYSFIVENKKFQRGWSVSIFRRKMCSVIEIEMCRMKKYFWIEKKEKRRNRSVWPTFRLVTASNRDIEMLICFFSLRLHSTFADRSIYFLLLVSFYTRFCSAGSLWPSGSSVIGTDSGSGAGTTFVFFLQSVHILAPSILLLFFIFPRVFHQTKIFNFQLRVKICELP